MQITSGNLDYGSTLYYVHWTGWAHAAVSPEGEREGDAPRGRTEGEEANTNKSSRPGVTRSPRSSWSSPPTPRSRVRTPGGPCGSL